jgi:hypothetical protein
MKILFDAETVEVIREQIQVKGSDGSTLINIRDEKTYRIMLCDIFLMLSALFDNNCDNGNNDGNCGNNER